jgi:hypothetical protein
MNSTVQQRLCVTSAQAGLIHIGKHTIQQATMIWLAYNELVIAILYDDNKVLLLERVLHYMDHYMVVPMR